MADMNNIPWLGSVYNTFEAMFPEVDEIMGLPQEGLEYLENQIQIVGANIKQFCSEFVQEVFIQSSVDPVEDAIQVEECKVSSYQNKENHSEEKQLQLEASDSATQDKRDPSLLVASPTYDDLENNALATIIPLGVLSSNSDNLVTPCESEVFDMELTSGETSAKSIGNPQSSTDDIFNLGSALMTKFDESCIVVDGSELLSDSHDAGRHRSSKKKFRGAVTASRLDNDKYGTRYRSPESGRSRQEGEGSESFIVTSSDNEFTDSDWEII